MVYTIKNYIKIILYYNNNKMFEDIRKFMALTNDKSNIECIQNYVSLVFPPAHPEEVNYYKDAKICLTSVVDDPFN